MKKEELALKNLSENSGIVIRAADKGGGVVLQDFEEYNKEALRIVDDQAYYEKIETRFRILKKGSWGWSRMPIIDK